MSDRSPGREDTLRTSSELFRDEALQYHRDAHQGEGSALEISPRWVRWSYWPLVAVVLTVALYSFFGTVDEYASGPAVVRAEGAIRLTATWPGTVESVDVGFGDRVAAGQVLVRFAAAVEIAEADRLQREFDLQLIRFLRNPSDSSARQSLASLRAQIELAAARLDQRLVRAPHAGTVSDVRIRPGQYLAPGDPVLSMVGPDRGFSVTAMLPGEYRPLLAPGMPLRLELAGYRYDYQNLEVESIGDAIIGPSEVQRYLGRELADTLFVPGPVVLVTTRLPGDTFIGDGAPLRYYDGMPGRIEARLRSERIVLALVPGLRAVFDDVP